MNQSTIIGRERELAILDGFLRSHELPAASIIEGEPGIGKTVLWHAAVEKARSRSFTVLTCRPSEAERHLSFAGLGDLMESIDITTIEDMPAPQRHALAAALLLESPEGTPPDARAIGSAMVSALRYLASRSDVIVAVDDLQWLDRASADALAFAARRLEDARVAFVLARRASSDDDVPLGLSRSLGEERCVLVDVGPLSLGALHRILRDRLGFAAPRPVILRIHEASAGNPFYALELARTLQEQGGRIEPGRPLPVPPTLQKLVGERVARQPAAVREAVAAVALTAHPMVATIEAVVRSDRAIDQAVEAGLLRAEGTRLVLTHPLIGPAALAAVGPQRQRRIHEGLASVVDDVESRARHMAAATQRPSAEVADALEEASEKAASRGAVDVAADLAELAGEATPEAARFDTARRMISAGWYHTLSGDTGRARDILETTIATLEAGPERARALMNLAEIHETDVEEGIQLFEKALLDAGDDEALAAEIDQAMSLRYFIQGKMDEALERGYSAVARARMTGDDVLLMRCIALLSQHETQTGRIREGLLEEGLELEERIDSFADHYASPSTMMGLRLMYAERVEEARGYFERAYGGALAAGDEAARSGLILHISENEIRAGRWEIAREWADEGVQLSDQIDSPQGRSALLYVRSFADAHLGRLEAARADAAEGREIAVAIGDDVFELQNLAVLGFVELSEGNHEAAADYLRDLPARLTERGQREPTTFPIVPNAVQALIMVGDVEPAIRSLGWLEEQGRAFDSPWALSQAFRCRGMIAASQGDVSEAEGCYQRALQEHGRMASPFEKGRTLLAYGSMLRRAKKKREARERLNEAIQIFDSLGASVWAEKSRGELARVSGRRPGGDALTETEGRIAELVAEGHSNKEVASMLFITARTVEANLTRIYSKLGIRSRTELAHRLSKDRTT
jgi:DNA-binding CsgD family transcriptional regulator